MMAYEQGKDPKALNWDSQTTLQVMCDLWNDCFRKILGHSDRGIAFELRNFRTLKFEISSRSKRVSSD